MKSLLHNKIQFLFEADKDGTGDPAKTGDDTGNTDKSKEKSLADTMYPDPDKEGEDNKDDEGEGDEKGDEKNADDEKNDKDAEGNEENKDDKKDDDDKKTDDESAYKDLTVPEGFDPISDEAKKLFTDSKLSKEDAQKYVDYSVKIQQDTIKAMDDAKEAQQKGWADTVDKDLKDEVPKAGAFVAKVCSDGFCDFLKESGLGDHPEMVKMMAQLADFSGEDFMGKETSSAEKKKETTLADSMYGTKYDND